MFAAVLKYNSAQPRDPKGTATGGQFTRAAGGGGAFNPADKATWYQFSDRWNHSPEDTQPYGWEWPPEGEAYVPPPVTHKVLRMPGIGIWGGSHYGSSLITGESAKMMNIAGYRDLNGNKEMVAVAKRMLEEIAADATGSEEPLYHSFENIAGTVFRPGDTLSLPLMATAGKPASYGMRLEHENQTGAPTYFAFAKGTPMVGYSKPSQKDLEDIGATTLEGAYKEQGHIWDEAIVAGRFTVTKIETKYMGSQHDSTPRPQGTLIHQLYGQVVHVTPTGVFNPTTGQWEEYPRG